MLEQECQPVIGREGFVKLDLGDLRLRVALQEGFDKAVIEILPKAVRGNIVVPFELGVVRVVGVTELPPI